MDLTVIIPARNERYLQRTIESVLAAMEADTEIIAVCDGYWPNPPINDHPRVSLIHHTQARGQRQGINAAARIARGKFLMKLDAHCAVGQGFDRILMADWQPGWTMVPTMYNLDVEKWEPKLHKKTEYMYIGFNDKDEMRALYYKGRTWREWHKRPALIDETMCCMGPGWFLSAEDFWKQDGCDETHGGWGQQGIEVSLKAWLSGGALMVDKNTWFSHWFRASDGGFPYHINQGAIDKARAYSKDLWLNDKWPVATRKLSWLVKKFSPPGWGNDVNRQMELNAALYQHIHMENREPTWRGVRIIKMPTDLFLYAEVIQQNKPKWIVETGTKFGGSSLWFQDCLDSVGEGGRVVTIDIDAKVANPDPRITYIAGSSRDREIVAQVKALVGSDTCMVVLDSLHARWHVKWELYHYAPMVTPGQYLVIEDCYGRRATLYGPGEARDWFLAGTRGRNFEQTNLDRRFLIGVCLGGWLRRKG
jgi:cephalosporin hydroxylase